MSVRMTEGKFKGLMRLSNSKGVIAAAAMDQRGSLQKSIAKAKSGMNNNPASSDKNRYFFVSFMA